MLEFINFHQEQANSLYLLTKQVSSLYLLVRAGADCQIMQDSPHTTYLACMPDLAYSHLLTSPKFLLLGLRFIVIIHRSVLATALYLLQI